MGKIFESIDENLTTWILARELFFVSTAPLSEAGLINCSPKGMDTFRVLDPHTVAYLDLTGSGIETAAHLKENGRIVIMFCAFQGPPKILRLHGQGSFHGLGTNRFQELKHLFGPFPGIRGVITVDVARIADACGFGVPVFEFVGNRDTLNDSAVKKGEEKLAAYRIQKNSRSIDGLAGI